jgi:hypothetical protein
MMAILVYVIIVIVIIIIYIAKIKLAPVTGKPLQFSSL